MKVVMSTDAVGGVWTYAVELRDALGTEGVEVELAAIGPAAPPDADVPHHRCALEWHEDPWADVADSGRWLLALAREAAADIVHLNGYAHGALTWPVPTIVVAHSCVLSWHESVRGAPAPAAWRRYRDEVRAGLDGATRVVAPTHAMRTALRRLYELERDVEVIQNGVSPGPGSAPQRAPVVLGAGRLWDEAKGLATLDRAAARLPWPVEVAGHSHGARARHARMLGPLPRGQLRARMAQAAIFAHPACYEPFGLAVLEAAQGGCALVLADIATLRELWDGAAAFVAPGDAAALTAALGELIADAPLRAQLAGRARQRAATLAIGRTAAAYARLYERLTLRQGCVA
jgi:glycosyltransferase involved in cell wall biosynthesis